MIRLTRLKTVFLPLFLPWLAHAQKPNVLLAGDLKPAMGCHADTHSITQAMDALEKLRE